MNGQFFVISTLALYIQLIYAGHSDPSQASTICAQPNSDGILISHEDCDKFYKCFKGFPYPLNCPNNLLWNPDKEYCDWLQNVICASVLDENVELVNDANKNEEIAIESNLKSFSEAAEVCAANDSEGKHVVHSDCEKYYVCTGRFPVEMSCPDHLHYNPAKKACDWPENVPCNN